MFLGPEAAGSGRRESRSRILYVSDQITITSVWVDVAGTRIMVAELQNVTAGLVSSYPLIKVAGLTVIVEAVIAVPLAVEFGSLAVLCAGFLSALGMAVGASVDARRNPRLLSLEAEVRGRWVTLFSTDDKTQFGQVRRAMMRAIEDYRESSM